MAENETYKTELKSNLSQSFKTVVKAQSIKRWILLGIVLLTGLMTFIMLAYPYASLNLSLEARRQILRSGEAIPQFSVSGFALFGEGKGGMVGESVDWLGGYSWFHAVFAVVAIVAAVALFFLFDWEKNKTAHYAILSCCVFLGVAYAVGGAWCSGWFNALLDQELEGINSYVEHYSDLGYSEDMMKSVLANLNFPNWTGIDYEEFFSFEKLEVSEFLDGIKFSSASVAGVIVNLLLTVGYILTSIFVPEKIEIKPKNKTPQVAPSARPQTSAPGEQEPVGTEGNNKEGQAQ